MVNNAPYNAGDVGSIPSQGTKIPHVMEQLSLQATLLNPTDSRAPHAATTEPTCHN